MFVLCVITTGKLFQQLFSEGEVKIAEYLPRRSRGKYPAIFTKPVVNNCFSIIFRGEYEENWAKHENENQMRLSLAITSRSNGNWTSCRTIQGVIGRVFSSRIYFIRVANRGETTIKRTQFSAGDLRARSETVRLQLSNYKRLKLDSCNWIPT